jgi:hypothetical protein
MTEADGETWLRPGEQAEWSCFTADAAFAALAGGADELFLRQLKAVGLVYDRLADKGDPLRCAVCRTLLAPPPGLIGYLKPVARDRLFAFALCYPCATDGSADFHQRFIAAIGGDGAYDVSAGRA